MDTSSYLATNLYPQFQPQEHNPCKKNIKCSWMFSVRKFFVMLQEGKFEKRTFQINQTFACLKLYVFPFVTKTFNTTLIYRPHSLHQRKKLNPHQLHDTKKNIHSVATDSSVQPSNQFSICFCSSYRLQKCYPYLTMTRKSECKHWNSSISLWLSPVKVFAVTQYLAFYQMSHLLHKCQKG